ncbi:MAG: ABC transporter ATP-binding protein/permease [Clostridium sp.]|jgi:ABC-type bacteriocin/lantibiotic exporter with double-glycine peptidase domain|nr:ABC transporter ATP-binding protein/permease [Clostridium sp.]
MKSKTYSAYGMIKRNMPRLFPYQIASYVLALVTIVISVVLVDSLRVLLDDLEAGEADGSRYLSILWFSLAYLITTMVFQFVFRRTQMVGRNEIVVLLYNKLQSKPLDFFREHPSGEILSLINQEGREVGDWLSFGTLVLFNEFSVLILNLMLMAYYDILLTLLLILVLSAVFLSTRFLAVRMAECSSGSLKTTGKVNQFILQTLKAETLIHILGKHRWFKSRLSDLVYRQRYPIDRKWADAHAVYMTVFLFLSVLFPVLSVAVGAYIFGGGVSIGVLLAFYALTSHIQEPIQYIPEFLSQRKNAIALAEHLLPIVEDDLVSDFNMEKLPEKTDKLKINVEYFSYSDGGNKLLRNIDFSLESKDVLLVKGISGVGKSTLVDLMMGFLKSERSDVTLNGISCALVEDRDRWRHMLFVGQETVLIEGTLAENILMGDEFPAELVREVIYSACLEDVMGDVSAEEIIGGEVDGVSGGQKQRISIARMLLRRPDILILDEPTSALDEATSKELADRITDFTRKYDMILIVVSHKPDFDQFVTKVLEIK